MGLEDSENETRAKGAGIANQALDSKALSVASTAAPVPKVATMSNAKKPRPAARRTHPQRLATAAITVPFKFRNFNEAIT
jgi:hypothetical protein